MIAKNNIIADLKTGASLLKYAYMDSGAENYIKILFDSKYHFFSNELEILEKHSAYLRTRLKHRIVVLGVGNAEKLQYLCGEENDFILVDINEDLLMNAAAVIGNGAIAIRKNFEDLDFGEFGDNITIIMLGGTLGNLDHYMQFMEKLRSSCPSSNIILGMEFEVSENGGDADDVLDSYINNNIFEFVFYPLRYIGFTRDDGDIHFFKNKHKKRVEVHFRFNGASSEKRDRLGLSSVDTANLGWSHRPIKYDFYEDLIAMGIHIGPFLCDNGKNSIIELFW